MEVALSRTWQWKTLLLWTILSVLLFASWGSIGATREWWDAFDLWVFQVTNGTDPSQPMAVFWALSGDRRFAYLSIIIVLGVHLAHISRADFARFRDGIAFFRVN